MKTCYRCGEHRLISEFYRNKKNKDGRQYHCKQCDRDMCQAYRDRNRELLRKRGIRWRRDNPDHSGAHQRKYRMQHIEQIRERAAKWRGNNKEKRIAQKKVEAAVARGELIPADTCGDCGEETKTSAHHWDYTKPLEVVWLCCSCHRRADRARLRMEGGENQC